MMVNHQQTYMFNPTLDSFLKEKKDITLVGLAWAMFWRVYLVILGACIAVSLIGSMSTN